MSRGKYTSKRVNVKNKKEKLSAEGRITDEVLINVTDVHKSFRVYFDKGIMLKERFVNPARSRYENREILKGVSFQIHRGETVALIGNNGCGKSTTLKMLTKILYPNKGTVTVNGKVSSLIELGAGFHPDMSGRENIYINGSILGLKREQIDERIEDIIRFSELEEFIDNPIRTYSSGMYMRLAFSVAINVDADILLIDEILAVGDQAFQEKCINKLNELRKTGVTVVLVSHSMGQVNSIADRCIWIDKGRVVEDGPTDRVCRHYEEEMERRRIARDKQEEKERIHENIISVEEKNASSSEKTKELSSKEKRELRKKRFSERWKGSGEEGYSIATLCAVAILLLCHATQDIYGIGYSDVNNVYPDLTFNMRLAGFTFFAIGRTGFPLILMCAGFRWLSNDFSCAQNVKSFWLNKLLPFFVTWEIWVLIYQLYCAVIKEIPFRIDTWIKQALFVEGTELEHVWFVPILMLLLATTPFIGILLQRIRPDNLKLILIATWIIVFLFPGLDLFGQVNGGKASYTISFDFVCYLVYFCSGYYLSLYVRRIWKGSREVVLYLVLLVFSVVTQFIYQDNNLSYLIWYSYFPISLMTLLEFDIVTRMNLNSKIYKVLKEIGKCAIGIFLIHRPIQEMILKMWLGRIGGLFSLRVILLWISSLSVCGIIVYAAKKIPYIGKVLFG